MKRRLVVLDLIQVKIAFDLMLMHVLSVMIVHLMMLMLMLLLMMMHTEMMMMMLMLMMMLRLIVTIRLDCEVKSRGSGGRGGRCGRCSRGRAETSRWRMIQVRRVAHNGVAGVHFDQLAGRGRRRPRVRHTDDASRCACGNR